MAESESSSRFSFFTSKKFLFILGGFVVVLALLAGGYYVWQKSYTQSAPAGQTDVEAVVGKVNKLMDLPTDEAPTLATVSDVNKLQGQEFFAKAQNGDQVLIYSKAKKAVLYRPSVDKIIEVGPVNIAPTQSETASSSAVASQTTEIKVALLNGTETVGLTRQVEPLLLQMSSLKITVVAKENAAKSDYTESIVVDVTGKNRQAATQLATMAKGKVGSLPAGETAVEGADIMIILGKSYTEQ